MKPLIQKETNLYQNKLNLKRLIYQFQSDILIFMFHKKLLTLPPIYDIFNITRKHKEK